MLEKQYSAKDIENKWYSYWMEKNYFHSEPDGREPYTIVIPPPNVTGILHMGHMLNNTVQDILIRKARMEGKNACWVPGTDHASIATEAKVVRMLRDRGIRKMDIGRDEFLEYAFEWKDKYGGIILEQLKMLGASCDWERTRFTMEPKLSAAVIKVFVDLYKKGHIYRGKRITNWDPEAKTVLSNEEVIYTEENSKLYYVKYQIEGGGPDDFVTVATVRPETIFGDTGVCVHPTDERYLHLHGKRAIVPMINRSVPIIADDYIDPEFGTGVLKVTPAHDQNDYALGVKYGLEVVDCLNDDGTMSPEAQFFIGEDRFEVRKKMKKALEECNALLKIEDYKNKVGRSERTNSVAEPRLTLQWFLRMEELAKPALEAVENGEIRFHPDYYRNTYRHWMSNIKDWCVSRQLWWGQRIPAWYYEDQIFVAETANEALEEARKATGKADLRLEDLRQDDDVVDTWFSSWLWPISVFDGFENKEELKYYYPTNTLVTAPEIIFFWVARMIMAGYEWIGDKPFTDVYFTGIVRDQYGKKMSKSLGNSPDAVELLKKYGADGVRFGLLGVSPAGGDIIFDAPYDKETKQVKDESALCEQGRNFCNKLWNALKLIKGWSVDENLKPSPQSDFAARWFEQALQRTISELDTLYGSFALSDALKTLYNFIWDDFCSWYLEWVKPDYEKPIDPVTLSRTLDFFEQLMQLLHPFMPFVTEEIWSNLKPRAEGEDCIVSAYPKAGHFDKAFLYHCELVKGVVGKVREVRNAEQFKPKELLPLFVKESDSARAFLAVEGTKEAILKLAFLEKFELTPNEPSGASFILGTEQYYVAFEKQINRAEEFDRLYADLEYAQKFVQATEGKLKNERFVSSAPAPVVEAERKKLADGQARVKILTEALAKLGPDERVAQ